MASPAGEECCFGLCSVQLEVSPGYPLDALRCPGFEFPGPLIHVLYCCYPSKVVYKLEAFINLDYLMHPIHEPSAVYCEQDRWHW